MRQQAAAWRKADQCFRAILRLLLHLNVNNGLQGWAALRLCWRDFRHASPPYRCHWPKKETELNLNGWSRKNDIAEKMKGKARHWSLNVFQSQWGNGTLFYCVPFPMPHTQNPFLQWHFPNPIIFILPCSWHLVGNFSEVRPGSLTTRTVDRNYELQPPELLCTATLLLSRLDPIDQCSGSRPDPHMNGASVSGSLPAPLRLRSPGRSRCLTRYDSAGNRICVCAWWTQIPGCWFPLLDHKCRQ